MLGVEQLLKGLTALASLNMFTVKQVRVSVATLLLKNQLVLKSQLAKHNLATYSSGVAVVVPTT
ncbi:hypothetical protein FC54_GL000369 [Ligilactobacillus saerimneri DSM 16049]|nr:hypothetical protein FC54_GL000369 [Ligilactobacillus saerimneri DSM 16049]